MGRKGRNGFHSKMHKLSQKLTEGQRTKGSLDAEAERLNASRRRAEIDCKEKMQHSGRLHLESFAFPENAIAAALQNVAVPTLKEDGTFTLSSDGYLAELLAYARQWSNEEFASILKFQTRHENVAMLQAERQVLQKRMESADARAHKNHARVVELQENVAKMEASIVDMIGSYHAATMERDQLLAEWEAQTSSDEEEDPGLDEDQSGSDSETDTETESERGSVSSKGSFKSATEAPEPAAAPLFDDATRMRRPFAATERILVTCSADAEIAHSVVKRINDKELDALLRRWMYAHRKHIEALAPGVVPVLQLWTTRAVETCPEYLYPLYEVADESTRGTLVAFAEEWDDRIRCLGCFSPYNLVPADEDANVAAQPCLGVNLDTVDQYCVDKGAFDLGKLRSVLRESDIVLKVNLAVYC